MMGDMRIGILGTGAVGRAFGRVLSELGHEITIGTRDPEATRARDEWVDSPLTLARYADMQADLWINATSGHGALAAVQAVGPALDGKVVIDTSNPLDFSHGFPPTLFVSNTDSLAEQLQRGVPGARIVKMFSTTANEVMVDPRGLGHDSTIFVAGDDEAARAEASALARELGWSDILDLGDLTAARGLEMWMPLWLRLYGAIGRADFNIKVIR